jgi:peptidoglycan/LPS O-acetylase OafA/YrhL
MQTRSHPYIAGLDLLRFLAAALVMIYHLGFWAWAFPSGQVARASKGIADFEAWEPIAFMGWAGVQIFFVISGFVIAVSSEHSTPFRFFVSRFVRLVPGVWVCATLTLAAWWVIDVDHFYPHVLEYVRSLLFYPKAPWIDSVYWTLGIEIAFYAMVFALVALTRFHWLKPLMCCIGTLSTMFWIGAMLVPEHMAIADVLQWVQGSRIAQLLLVQHGMFFAIGVLLWMQLLRRASLDQVLWLALFVVGGCLQIVGETQLKVEKTGLALSALGPLILWLGSLLFILVAVPLNARIASAGPAFLSMTRRLGLMTYPLYLLHNVVGGSVMGVVASWGASSEAAFATAVVSTIALSWWVSVVPEPALQRSARALFAGIKSRMTLMRGRAPASD